MSKSRLEYIYHLVDERNWASIQKNGLLCTAQLLKISKDEQWSNCYRPQNIQLQTGVIIRDQRPMPPNSLAKCLMEDLTPEDWYLLLNQRIFFWCDIARLYRQFKACVTPQYMMSIDAQALLQQYAASASVTAFNTGNAKRAAALRGPSSFVPYTQWLQTKWETEYAPSYRKSRPHSHKPVELTIVGNVPNIFDYVVNVEKL